MIVAPVDRHDLTVAPDGTVWCRCGLRCGAEVWAPAYASRIAHAHIANPSLPVTTLLAFVSGRPIAEVSIAEQMGALRDLVTAAGRCADVLADIAVDPETVVLAVGLQELVERTSL